MRRSWLLFSQLVTILLAVYFVLVSLKPQWLQRGSNPGSLTVIEAPAGSTGKITGGAPGSFSTAAKAASGAVVSIIASKAAVRTPNTEDPWFRFFFGDQVRNETQVGLGSGVIVSPNGYILTNNHVIASAVTSGGSISVRFQDGSSYEATVVGRDASYDLAVLRISNRSLPALQFGDSDKVAVGRASNRPTPIGSPVSSQ